jgi:histidine ammonia-lyase
LVSDSKTLAHPDSVDSIPTSAGQEDHVSMGANAARHAREIIRNSEMVVAIEMLTAAQALDLRSPELRRGRGTEVAHHLMRKLVPTMDEDHSLSRQMGSAAALVHSGEIPAAIASQTGEPVESFFL